MRLATISLLTVMAVAPAARADVLRVGDRAAELDVAVDRAGKPVRLAALRGQWVVVTVGAAWCAPCKKELPIWDRLAGKQRGRVVFVAVSVDDDPEDGKRFHERLGLAHMRLAYLPASASGVAARYGAATMPSTFVVDPSGVVRYVKSGFDKGAADAEYAAMDAQLTKLVGAAPRPPAPPARPPPAKPTTPAPEPTSPAPETTESRPADPPAPTEPAAAPATPPPEAPAPEPEPEPPFARGFVFDVDAGVGMNGHGGTAVASGFGAVALTPALALGLRFAVGTARNAGPGHAQFALAAAAADYTRGKLTFGAAVGAGVTDQHGGLAWDARGGYEVYRRGKNHFVAGLDLVDLYSSRGGAFAITATIGLHRR